MKKNFYIKTKALLLSCMLSAFSLNSMAADITTGRILHYDFNTVNGTVVPDVSGNSMDGTTYGSPAGVEGKEGNALNFPTVDDYMTAPAGLLSDVTDFSFATWVNISTLNQWSRIFDFGNDTNNYLFLTPRSSAGNLRFAIKNGGGEQLVDGNAPLATGKWVHVAITFDWDDATSAGTGCLYVDGNLVGENKNMTLNPSMLGVTELNYIAKSQWPDPTLAGKLDDFMIFRRALAPSDVLTLAGIPAELITAYDELNANTLKADGDLTNVTENLNLPQSIGNVNIQWASTLATTVGTDGRVQQPEKYPITVKLTATFTMVVNEITYTLVKTFNVTVPAQSEVPEVIAQWNFATSSIRFENGKFVVTDATENKFEGTTMNEARIRTIGGETSGQVNVLDLGEGKGYFDMGTEIGKAVYALNNYTVAAYFRIDDSYTELNSNGNYIWNFSNSADAPKDMNGYIIGSLKNQAHNITTNYWASGDQEVGLNQNAPKGSWHHIAFTQNGNTGTLYVDGVEVAQNTAMTNLPSTALPKEGLTGTLYNWLGRSCYPGDVYLRKTLLYDFRLFSVTLTSSDIVDYLGVNDSISKLNAAYEENPDFISESLTNETLALTMPDLSNVTTDIELPAKGSIDETVMISWSSSRPSIISSTGQVTRPEYFDFKGILTATLTKNGQKLTKEFPVTVKVKEGTEYISDLLMKHDFSNVNGNIATDVAEKNFTATIEGNAAIKKMGTTKVYNVLALDRTDGYLDLGTEVGKIMYNLDNFTISAFYRIDENNIDLGQNGNMLWTFSNSSDVINERNGYIIGSLNNLSHNITPQYYPANTGHQGVAFGSVALKGGWHNLTYVQNGETGTIYVDGWPSAPANITNLPKNTLPIAGRDGTLYNWLGRSPYALDINLHNTLIYDFRLYKKALTDEEVLTSELNVMNTLYDLEAAYEEGITSVKKLSNSPYKLIPVNGGLRITGLSGNEQISITDITGRTVKVSDSQNIRLQKGIYIITINQFSTKYICL